MGIDPSGRWGQPDGTAAATVTAGRRNPAVAAPPHPKEPGVGKSLRDPEGHSWIRRDTAGSGGAQPFQGRGIHLDPAVIAQVPPPCPSTAGTGSLGAGDRDPPAPPPSLPPLPF